MESFRAHLGLTSPAPILLPPLSTLVLSGFLEPPIGYTTFDMGSWHESKLLGEHVDGSAVDAYSSLGNLMKAQGQINEVSIVLSCWFIQGGWRLPKISSILQGEEKAVRRDLKLSEITMTVNHGTNKGRLERSPYRSLEIISQEHAHLDRVNNELKQKFCSRMGQCLEVVIDAGVECLGKWFLFHSVFMCPVLRERGSDVNPPMLMPCGHVISHFAIEILSELRSHPFKCPYCPSEVDANLCRQIYF